MAARKRHDADRRPTAKAPLQPEDLDEEVAQPARDLVDLGELGRADNEVEAAHNRRNAVEITHRLLDPGDDVEPGLPRRLIALGDAERRAEPAEMKWLGAALRHVP